MPDLQITSVLIMLDDFASIRKTINALRAQTIAGRLELIIVTLRGKAGQIDQALLQGFGRTQVIELDEMPSAAHGWAAGIEKTSSPVVVLSEDHGYPEPAWAERLVEAHRGDAAAVCPAMQNANPGTASSWANFALCFIEWFAPDSARPVEFGPSHNTSYKADVLRRHYLSNMVHWLTPERVLFYDLAAKGLTVLIEPGARLQHVNISQPMAYFAHSFAGGRIFGSSRALQWGWIQKILYGAAFPLVPWVRLRRIMRFANTADKRRQMHFFRALPLIVLGLHCHAVAEAIGYFFGKGNALEVYMEYEMRRRLYVIPQERAMLAA